MIQINENELKLCLNLIKLLPESVHSLANQLMDDQMIGEPIAWLRHNIERFVDEEVIKKLRSDESAFELRSDLKSVCDQMIINCDIIIDKMWEIINCLDWTRVGLQFRYCFGFTSLLKALIQIWSTIGTDDNTDVETRLKALKTIDMALLMSPRLDSTNILAKMASVIHRSLMDSETEDKLRTDHQISDNKKQKLNNHCEEVLAEDLKQSIPYFANNDKNSIKRVKDLSLDEFRDKYLVPKIPVIITDCMSDWPAISDRKWTVDYIERAAAYRTVPIEIGIKYTDEEWSQKLMTIRQFIDQFIANSSADGRTGYLAQHNLFDQIEELMADISVPDYCSMSRDIDSDRVSDVDINGWFGPSNTVSPLHYDPKDNLFCQVLGQKYVRLYSDETPTEAIYPSDCRLLFNTSLVDLENVDSVKFGNFTKIDNYCECVVNCGEMLYIPNNYWHFVKSLSTSFSISFWWK